MAWGTIFLNKEWFEKNKDKFASDHDAMAKEGEKGKFLMIKLDDLVQDGNNFDLSNNVLHLDVASVEDKETKVYTTMYYDVDVPIQEKIASWMISRLAKLQGAARLLLQADEAQ